MKRGTGTMSSDRRSPWDTVIENLTGPWDLVVISAGVAAAAVAAALGPWSQEEVLPVGAFGGMAILKGVQALLARRGLRRRVKGIEDELFRLRHLAEDRVDFLARELGLWMKHVTTNAEFSQLLDELVKHARSLWENEYDKRKNGKENLLSKIESESKAEKARELADRQAAFRRSMLERFISRDNKGVVIPGL